MNAVDTNVIIYRIDRRDPRKRLQARDLLHRLARDEAPTIIPWQVLGEYARQLRAWKDQRSLSNVAFERYLAVVRALFPVIMPTEQVLDLAIDLASRHSLSHWDSMLLGACKECGVTTLYTEDMGAPLQVDSIRLINPFK